MLESLTQVKKLILWCQKNKVKSLKINNIQFELSELGFVEDLTNVKEMNLNDSKPLIDKLLKDEEISDEDLLFWSSGSTSNKG